MRRPKATVEDSVVKTEMFPLTVLEELFLWGGFSTGPGLIYFRMRFAGVLRREVLQAAACVALGRHQLLRSRVAISWFRRAYWVVFPERVVVIDWTEGPMTDDFGPRVTIDLTREPGLRLRVSVDPAQKRSELLIILHHACADAAGIQQFTEDLMAAYAGACGAALPALVSKPLQPAFFRRRGRFGLTWDRIMKLVPGLLVGLVGVRQYLMRKPESLGVDFDPGPQAAPHAGYPATLIFTFDSVESDRLLQARRELGNGVTLNDLLARDLFLAIAEWRRREQSSSAEGWLRLMIPVNMRARDAQPLPAANAVGVVFLDRQPAQMLEANQLLRGIHEQLDLVKRNCLGLIFISFAWLTRLIPGASRRTAQRHRRLGTAIFSNLGQVYERAPLPRIDGRIVAGEVTLEEIAFVAPHYPGTNASFTSTTYADRLTITMHYDLHCLNPQQAQELFDGWIRALRESMAPR
jgi:hypothetical protein